MRRGFIVGIVGWGLATLLFRLYGPALLDPDITNPAVLYVVGGVLVAALALLVTRLVCMPGKAVRFGAALAGIGLLLSSAATNLFGALFPYNDPADAAAFAALMLYGYGVILLTILTNGERVTRGVETANG